MAGRGLGGRGLRLRALPLPSPASAAADSARLGGARLLRLSASAARASAVASVAGAASARLRGDAARLGGGDVAPDVDPPAGQAGGEPGVLALAADRQREHPLGHGDGSRSGAPRRWSTPRTWAGRQRVRDEHARVLVPRDDVDLLAGELGDDRLDARAALADRRADRVEALLARRDGDLRAAAGLARDRLDLDRPRVDLGHLELEQAAQEPLVGPAHEDLRPARRAPDLEHVRLDRLADAVVLERALLARREDRLDALADVEDDRARLDPADASR